MSTNFIVEGHAENVLKRMWDQCENKQLYDVVLIGNTDEIEIPAHRSVLCTSSNYFESMFTAPFYESTANEVKMSSMDSVTLKSLVEFCYKGSVKITKDTVEELLVAANFLLLGAVVDACGNFMAEQLHLTNCLKFMFFAERYHCQSLLKKAQDFCCKSFLNLCKTSEFLDLSAGELFQLLSSDCLGFPGEEDFFQSLMAWIEHKPFEREQHKDDLIKFVRMPLMKLTFLVDQVKPCCTSTSCLQLYNDATEWHSSPESKTPNVRKPIKPRRCNPLILAIKKGGDKMFLTYHCPKRLNWMTWLKSLEYSIGFGVALMDENLFIVGGMNRTKGFVNTTICINLKTMNLQEISPMNESRNSLGTAVLQGFLFAVGGKSELGDSCSAEKWDPKTNTWTVVAPMKHKRSYFGIAVLNDKMYVVGGYSSYWLSSAECYDPHKNIWKSIAPARMRELLEVRNLQKLICSFI